MCVFKMTPGFMQLLLFLSFFFDYVLLSSLYVVYVLLCKLQRTNFLTFTLGFYEIVVFYLF